MLKRTLSLCLAAVLAVTVARAELVEQPLEDATFGKLTVYQGSDEPKGVVLLAANTGGWTPETAAIAREIAQRDYVVGSINLDDYLARLERAEAACVDPSADLDRLNRLLEDRYPIVTHQPPILLGLGAGAALVYSALSQSPDDRFHAGVSVDFCPQLPLHKPLCKPSGNVDSAGFPDSQGIALKPIARMPTTWFVFQNRPACDSGTALEFIKAIQLTRPTEIAGTEGSKTWLPQVAALLQWLDPSIDKQVQPDAGITTVPLTEVPVTGGPDRPQFGLMLSGDGGWALLDRAVTAELAKQGLPVVGWDSLSYFWKARRPEELALDLERVLQHYLTVWQKPRIVLLGYSFGADVLPAAINRLPAALRERIDLVVLLGLSEYASFEFNLSHWVSDAPDEGDVPVRPELEVLKGLKRLCIYGTEETGALCPKLSELGVIINQMPGNHHFDEDYVGVAHRILDQLPPLSPTPPPVTSTPPKG